MKSHARAFPPAWFVLMNWLGLIVISCAGLSLALAADVPFLTGRVVDNAEIMSPAARERLTNTLKAYEDQTGTQITVLTLQTLEGDSIEEYATRVFEQWKLGKRGKDNGVLVVVVPQDRRMRIEVGYGLEGALPDVAASRIVRNVMTPRFKESEFDRGIEDGVGAIIAQLEGRPDAATGGAASGARSHARNFLGDVDTPTLAWPLRILVGAFIFGIIGMFTFIGISTPGAGGWFLYVFLIPFWAMFPIVIVGPHGALALLATYVVAFPVAKVWLSRTAWYQKAAHDLKTTGHASIGGMVLSSGGSSSGSDSGGGFSGGGGSSGGGGASGSW
ncbi:MAG: TPM domain-containing protein [Pseudomonadota bacterium]|nr:TPM domain-containing protein [Pseudomonadota bacterium]